MTDRLDIIRATVAALRRDPPPGMADCAASGIGVHVVEQEDSRSYRVELPAGQPLPEPTGIRAAVIAEYGRQRLRLAAADATAESARTDPASPATRPAPVVREARNDAGRLSLVVSMPWSDANRRALAQLERQRAEQLERERLAVGPPDVTVIVEVDPDGRPDLVSQCRVVVASAMNRSRISPASAFVGFALHGQASIPRAT